VSDYLWDKSGEDADVERLEQALSPLRYRGQAPRLPERRPRLLVPVLAVAAAAMLAVLMWQPWRPAPWVPNGQWVEATERLELAVGNLGTVTLSPGTRARAVGDGRLELDHGVLAAKIDAPPRRFSVATKFALIIDLGCAFEVAADENGVRVKVTEGSVAVSQEGRETVIAAGAEQTVTPPPPAKKAEVIAPKAEAPKAEAPKAEAPKAPKLKVLTPKVAPARPAENAAPHKNEAPATKPAKKDDGLHLQHDSLKDLDRSL
jgi:ferric-dicitrate binding protein FerR (iron transport regulator)